MSDCYNWHFEHLINNIEWTRFHHAILDALYPHTAHRAVNWTSSSTTANTPVWRHKCHSESGKKMSWAKSIIHVITCDNYFVLFIIVPAIIANAIQWPINKNVRPGKMCRREKNVRGKIYKSDFRCFIVRKSTIREPCTNRMDGY